MRAFRAVSALAGNVLVAFLLVEGSANGATDPSGCGAVFSLARVPNVGPSDNVLMGIASLAADDVWAVGRHDPFPYSTLTEHWDGARWTVVSSPNQGDGSNFLEDVGAASSDDVWAVGESPDPNFGFGALTMHWDGAAWTIVPAPHVGNNSNILHGVAAISSGFAPTGITGIRAAGVVWQFDPHNSQQHTVTDASGMGLFDSGPRDAGSSFSFGFFSAGAYPVVDTLTSNQGRVTVPVRVSPREGELEGTFRVEWALAPLPAGFVADVQIKRPGSNSDEDWITGQTVFAADFMPDGGTGKYLFRARLRSTVNGEASDYTPGTAVFVS